MLREKSTFRFSSLYYNYDVLALNCPLIIMLNKDMRRSACRTNMRPCITEALLMLVFMLQPTRRSPNHIVLKRKQVLFKRESLRESDDIYQAYIYWPSTVTFGPIPHRRPGLFVFIETDRGIVRRMNVALCVPRNVPRGISDSNAERPQHLLHYTRLVTNCDPKIYCIQSTCR